MSIQLQTLPIIQDSARTVSWMVFILRNLMTSLILISLLIVPATVEASHLSESGTPASVVPARPTSLDMADPPRRVMVELTTPPVAHVYAEQQVHNAGIKELAAITQAHLATVQAEQYAMSAALFQLGVTEIYRLQRIYNGIAVLVDQDRLAAIRGLPGVAAIHPMVAKQPDHQRSVPFVGAPALWGGTINADGDGITIAVIDTGVDYLHANMAGSRDYANNDPTVIGDVPDFPGAVVIGGYDFAGDRYDADPENSSFYPFPQPDPDPMDCYEHGAHVAGTLVGRGVLTAQTEAFVGPYDQATYENKNFEIGPGMAPRAKLYALKVFGCQGSSDLTELAIEWAVDPNGDGDFSDRVDVINMSLGSSFGSVQDPTAVASDNAARIGVIVVASAGNTGDVTYATGSPAVASRVISVAAARDHLWGVGSINDAGAATRATYFSSRGPRRGDAGLKPDIAAPGESILSTNAGAPGTDGIRLSGTSMAAPHVAGAMALLRQRLPTWRVEELKALVMNTARVQTPATETPFSTVRVGSGHLDLPNALRTDVIAYNADDAGLVGISFGTPAVVSSTAAIKNLRLQNKGENDVTYEVGYLSTVDTPGIVFSWEEERVTVPAGGYANLPLRMDAVAEEMRRTRPSNMSETQGQPRHWLSEEAGHLMLWPVDGRFQTTAISQGTSGTVPGPSASATFGYGPTDNRLAYRINLSSFTPDEIEAVEIRRGLPGESGAPAYPIEPPAGWVDSSTSITGVLTLTTQDEALLASGALQLHIQSSQAGAAALNGQLEPDPAVIHVPLFAAPRPASAMRSTQSVLQFSNGAQAVQPVVLAGQALSAEEPRFGFVSLVSAFELQHSSQIETLGGNVEITLHADVAHVGITDDLSAAPEQRVEASHIYFGIATHADWSTPNEVEFNILIDIDEDGVDDYRLFNSDARGYSFRRWSSDAFVAVVEDLTTGEMGPLQTLNQRSPAEADTALFNTNVMMLPVPARDIGLSNENPDFDYRIESFSNEAADAVEITPNLRYDLSEKAVDLFSQSSDGPIFEDRDGNAFSVEIDVQNYLASGGKNLLLLHHHNVPGNRVEVVELKFEWPTYRYFPVLENR